MPKFERVVLPFGEWAPDENFLSQTGNLDGILNLLRVDGNYSRIPKPVNITNTVAAGALTPSSALGWSDENGGNRAAVAVYEGHLYAVSIGGATLTDRCKAGHYTASNEWSMVKFGPNVIATNSADPVQLFNFTAASADLITSTTKPRGRFLAVCRGHLILASISSPVSNYRQFRWSALNDGANFEPGTNRSGFAELSGDAGIITGAQGFEDFFLLFSTCGVYRASYIGGADVWSLQQVGNFHDALPGGFSETIVAVGRDAYYLGRSGPKVVVNGEAVEDVSLGKCRRFMMDKARNSFRDGGGIPLGLDTTIPYGSRAFGVSDGFRQLIYWGWQATANSGDHLVLYAYSLIDGSMTLSLPEEELIGNPFTHRLGALFSRTGAVTMAGAGENPGFGIAWVLSDDAFPSPVITFCRGLQSTSYLNASMVTKAWRPSIPTTQIHAVRPLWKKLGSLQYPAITITINGTIVLPMGSAQQDDRGFIHPLEGPYSASEHTFEVTINEVGAPPSSQLRDFVGLELEVTSEKSHS